ncbi:hypothetical protein [Nocardiopsis metallicus]|uniref:Uncharacterized protein n=1 Tax=Nocardiopsis metallicus TaxID=179819 RepID=A0A840WMH0_9ACTN|nr:hypothetical protein [Nocardiopsis metallicus]MBB5492837.1 hypothetical protein [Nocardiopsis metallicus]
MRVLTPDSVPEYGSAAAPASPPEGSWTVDAGHRPPAARVSDLVAEGHTVLVRCTRPAGQEPRTDLPPAPPGIAGAVPVEAAEEVALATVYAWAGASVFVTAHPERVRRALDMVASVRGERPPAAVRRGLA